MNTFSLDLTDADTANALKDCKVGEQETLTLKVTPTAIVPGKSIDFDIDEIGYTEGSPEEEAKESPDEEKTEVDAGEGDAVPAKKKSPPAIAIVMGDK